MSNSDSSKMITTDELNSTGRTLVVPAGSLAWSPVAQQLVGDGEAQLLRALDNAIPERTPDLVQWLASPPHPVPGPKQDIVVYLFDQLKFRNLLETFLDKHAYSWTYGLANGYWHYYSSSADAKNQYKPDFTKPKSVSLEQWIKDVNYNKITENSRLNLGSISKTITTVGMLRLLEDVNKPELDSEIGPYLPYTILVDWPAAFKKITFRMLLNHTSGIQDFAQADSWQQNVAWYIPVPLPAPWFYSSTNFTIVTLLASAFFKGGTSKNAGIKFAEYIRSQILSPIGIKNAIWGPSGQLPISPKAYEFGKTPGTPGYGDDSNTNLESKMGPAGQYLSAKELLTFVENLRPGSLLSKYSLAQMNAPTPQSPDYGLGVHLYHENEQKDSSGLAQVYFPTHYNHGGDRSFVTQKDEEGGKFNFKARWVSVREVGFHVVVLSNCCDGLDGPDAADFPKDIKNLISNWFNYSTVKAIIPP